MRSRLAQLAMMLNARVREQDKRLHAGWSFALTLLAGTLLPLPWAIAAVVVIGIGKECWDHRYGTGFSLLDIAANAIGITGATLVILILPLGLPWVPWPL